MQEKITSKCIKKITQSTCTITVYRLISVLFKTQTQNTGIKIMKNNSNLVTNYSIEVSVKAVQAICPLIQSGMQLMCDAAGEDGSDMVEAATQWLVDDVDYMTSGVAENIVFNPADVYSAVVAVQEDATSVLKEENIRLFKLINELQPVVDQLVCTAQNTTSLESVYNDDNDTHTDWADVADLMDRIEDVTNVASQTKRPIANA